MTIIPRSAHKVSRTLISNSAKKVLNRLQEGGFEAFLVGGSVRDLQLGLIPKDFDIATDAHPEQVKTLFRNCRLIGRRFRLAHVYYGREVIEVATFRGNADDGSGAREVRDGRLVRDNVYGDIVDDAFRRDFTVNALYYNMHDFTIRDYCQSFEDINQGVLRFIGDPISRYMEDPVRLLRAVRFAAKLGFKIAKDTESPLFDLGHLLSSIAAARLFEEVLKLFLSGHAERSFLLLRQYGLFACLFPMTEKCLETPEQGDTEAMLLQALRNTDERIKNNKPVTPAFLLAAFLWEPMRRRKHRLAEEGLDELEAMNQAADQIIREQVRIITIPKRFSHPMREIWAMQPRLNNRRGKRVLSLVNNKRFRAAYDFLLLRVIQQPELECLADWWTDFQELSEDEQFRSVAGAGARRRSQRRPHK